MLKVDNVMRFDLLFAVVLVTLAMFDEFPETLALILVNYRRSVLVGLFDRRTIFDILPTNIPWVCLPLVSNRCIQVNCRIVAHKVHIAVSTHVIDQQLVIEENRVSVVLITAMRVDLPDSLRRRKGTYFDHEGTFASVCCFL